MFTLVLDYDRIILDAIKFEMGSHQLIKVPHCNLIIITSNNLKGVA